jgi:hypothetical protein
MKALPKSELLLHMQRFNADKERGISIPLFCELAGISTTHFREVFINQTHPMSETVQRRVNKAYMQWKAGWVRVMKRNDNTRYVDYRRQAKPPIMQGMGLKVTSEGIKLRVGMVNRHDYSEIDLNEALRG